MKRRFAAAALSAALLLSTLPAAGAEEPSAWASKAVTWLQGTGKLTEADFSGYGRTVTRADFARLGVILYELITVMPTPDVTYTANPFTDTDDINVLRAYKIGLVNGTGDGTTFSPDQPVNREQIAVMLMRVLKACDMPYSQASTADVRFADESQLSGWAAGDVKRAYLIQIMNGTGGNAMSPQAPVTMEQAYQLLYNIYTNRQDIRNGKIRLISSGPVGTLSLKYAGGGKYDSGWCEEAYNAQPAVCDLEGDGTLEIVAAAYSLTVLDAATGNLKWRVPSGYDRTTADAQYVGRAWADVYVGDIDGDGGPEIVVPADVGQICAYEPDGTQVRAADSFRGGVVWGRVGAFSDAAYEASVPNGGFGWSSDYMGNKIDELTLPMNERLVGHFTHSKAVIADLDGNGANEVAVVGAVHDRAKGPLPSLYHEPFLFNGDRTRFNSAWAQGPGRTDAPLSEDWYRIKRCVPDPVAADVDGDGKLELLYPDFSGKLNCYWLDHTQKGNWPLNVYDGTTVEYATAPVVRDLNGDGVPEIVFATYTEKTGTKKGSLCVADPQGNLLQKIALPDSFGADPTPNGSGVPPVIADVDADGKPEIVLHAYLSAVTVYDLD